MRALALFLAATTALPLAACADYGSLSTERIGSAQMKFANGLPAGTVQMFRNGDNVQVTGALAGLSAGTHAVHLHTTGTCTAPDFTSAGGHLNPEGNTHGSQSPGGAHLGDMPNFTVTANGAGTFNTTLDGSYSEAVAALFDNDGTAVVVHAGADDYRTDPAGDAGSRVACGVVTQG
ncbi:superoxide dismutase family protein [Altererythrobacter sp. CAU 1778]